MENVLNITDGVVQDFENGASSFKGGTVIENNGSGMLSLGGSGAVQLLEHNGSDENGVGVSFDMFNIGSGADEGAKLGMSLGGHSIHLDLIKDAETDVQKGNGVYASVAEKADGSGYSVNAWVPNIGLTAGTWTGQTALSFLSTGDPAAAFAVDNVKVAYADTAKRDLLLVNAEDATAAADALGFTERELTATSISDGWDSVGVDLETLKDKLLAFKSKVDGKLFRDSEDEVSDGDFETLLSELTESLATWGPETDEQGVIVGPSGFDQRSDELWRLLHEDSGSTVPENTAMDTVLLTATLMFGLSSGFALAGLGAATATGAASTISAAAGSGGFLAAGIHAAFKSENEGLTSLPDLPTNIEIGEDVFAFIEEEVDRRPELDGGEDSPSGQYVSAATTAMFEYTDFMANTALMTFLGSEAEQLRTVEGDNGLGELDSEAVKTIEELGFTVDRIERSTDNGESGIGSPIFTRTYIRSGDGDGARNLEADEVRLVHKQSPWGDRFDSLRIEVDPLGVEESWL